MRLKGSRGRTAFMGAGLVATGLMAVLCLSAAVALGPRAAAQTTAPNLGRSVYGVVLDGRNRPIAAAIVYLKNASTKAILTAITDDHGAYSFHQLAPNTGYELHAEWKGKRSPVRVDSKYEMQPTVRLDLKIPVA